MVYLKALGYLRLILNNLHCIKKDVLLKRTLDVCCFSCVYLVCAVCALVCVCFSFLVWYHCLFFYLSSFQPTLLSSIFYCQLESKCHGTVQRVGSTQNTGLETFLPVLLTFFTLKMNFTMYIYFFKDDFKH